MKKILKITGISLLSIIVLLLVLPFLFRGKIIEQVKKAANENLNAKVDFSDVNISLLTNFPNLKVGLENVTVDNIAPFEGVRLAEIGEFQLVMDIMSVFGDEINLKKIGIIKPKIDVRVTAEGIANYDIAKPDTLATETPAAGEQSGEFKLKLKRFFIEDGSVAYDDKSIPYSMYLTGLNNESSGDMTATITELITKTTIASTTASFDGVTYVSNAKTDIKATLGLDMSEGIKITFKDNEIALNELFLAAEGYFAMPPNDTFDMDIKFAATKTDFRNLLSMVPAEFASDLSGVNVSGKMGFDGFVRGIMSETSMPGFGINITVENGNFKYPDLPKSVNNIQVKASIDASDGNDYDKMKIDVDQFHLEMAENPVDMKLKLRTPMSDPDIDFTCAAKVDLDNLKEFIPVEQGDEVHGKINADLNLKGKMSSVEKEQYDQFHAAGQVDIINVFFKSDSLPYDMNIESATFLFNPMFCQLDNFKSRIGRSDLSASGKIDNYLQYLLKDSMLTGSFNVSSNLLDLNEFMTEEEVAATDPPAEAATPAPEETAMSAIELPGNVDFTLNSSLNKLIYGTTEITNVNGAIQLKDKVAMLKNLKFNVLEGSVDMNGSYNAQNLSKPSIDFQYDIQNMDIQESAKAFSMIDKMAPIAKYCDGLFSTKMSIVSDLTQKMEPINASVNGLGTLSTKSVTVSGFKPMEKAADVLKIERLKKQSIQDVNVSFKIIEGVINVDPFTVKMDGMAVKLYGYTTMDQNIEYNAEMEIPLDKFPQGIANQANSIVAQFNQKAGTNVSVGSKIPVKLRITGTVTDPQIGTNYGDAGKDAIDNLKDQVVEQVKEEVKEQLNEAIDDSVEKARAAAAKLVSDAQKQADAAKVQAKKVADQAKSELYKLADDTEKSAKNILEKSAKKIAADKIRKEADEKHAKAIAEANKNADKIVAEAKAKGDKMITDAELQSKAKVNK